MYYWRIHINHGRGGSYDVYYYAVLEMSDHRVISDAVRTKHLISNDVPFVESVKRLTREEYLEKAYED
jgi:hypothetical protein